VFNEASNLGTIRVAGLPKSNSTASRFEEIKRFQCLLVIPLNSGSIKYSHRCTAANNITLL